jgi:ribosomal 30S subunit maturation factor RimM
VLAIDGPRGEILIPFAVDICVEIDVAAKRIRIDPPEGLLELNETQSKRQRAVGSGQ